MIVPPGLSSPWRSASSIIFTAIRSLIELPGLKVSILTKTSAAMTPCVIRLMRTIGVPPIASRIVLQIGFKDAFLRREALQELYRAPLAETAWLGLISLRSRNGRRQ